MFDILPRLFIKNYKDTADPTVREGYGTLSSVAGIIINTLLFASKFTVGTLTGSVSIRADGINNLSDAGSSIISLISFKISGKPADREHPFGHARIEYIASLLVSFIILHISIDLFTESVDKILHPTPTEFGIISIIALVVSILFKLWMYIFNRTIGKKINSVVIAATAADSISDVIATGGVLISVIVSKLTNFNTDGWMGIIVAVLIMIGGLKILNESKNLLLGSPPDPDMVKHVVEHAKSHPEVLGVHDVVIHNYGPGRCFASLHVEVGGSADVFATHDVIDNIEREIAEMYGIHCAVHMDPIVTNDELVSELREKVKTLATVVEDDLKIHDFRLVTGPTHSNLIFDVDVPFETKLTDSEIRHKLQSAIKTIDDSYYAVITVDRN